VYNAYTSISSCAASLPDYNSKQLLCAVVSSAASANALMLLQPPSHDDAVCIALLMSIDCIALFHCPYMLREVEAIRSCNSACAIKSYPSLRQPLLQTAVAAPPSEVTVMSPAEVLPVRLSTRMVLMLGLRVLVH
jgi:hypothetical protein